jgi:hypothetical protein
MFMHTGCSGQPETWNLKPETKKSFASLSIQRKPASP